MTYCKFEDECRNGGSWKCQFCITFNDPVSGAFHFRFYSFEEAKTLKGVNDIFTTQNSKQISGHINHEKETETPSSSKKILETKAERAQTQKGEIIC